MKKATPQEYPPGWSEKKVLGVIAHYDRQTEVQGAAEIEAAPEAQGETWMCVPTELVGDIARLIEDHAKKSSPARPRNYTKKSRSKKART
jgi:hypothetical protein